MKTILLWKLIFYLFYLFDDAFSYLSSEDYRTYTPIKGDYDSEQFYSYFKLKLTFFPNNPSLYIRTCDEGGTVFGSFRNGELTTFFDFSGYGSMGFNFDILVQKEKFLANQGDRIDFSLNNNLVYSLKLDKFESKPLETKICGRDVYLFEVNLIYENQILRYPPLTFLISTSFNSQSNIDWSMKNLNLVKISCPEKCSVCDSQLCLECNTPFTKFRPNLCYCDSEKDYYDYSDKDQVINCQPKYIPILKENFNQPFSNYNWFWNNFPISSFYFQNLCKLSQTIIFGGYNTFGDRDVISKVIKLNDNQIFSNLQPPNNPYKYINLANYKISFTVAYVNWDDGNYLKIIPTTKNNQIDMNISNNDKYDCDLIDNTRYLKQEYSYSGLYDNPKYANISMMMPPTPSRKNNNFGLIDFTFLISTCHKSCKTCSSPSYDGCQSCADPNTDMLSGQCLCKSGFERDPFYPDYPCVPVINKNIISGGIAYNDELGHGSILTNNMRMSSKYCHGKRRIVGGYINTEMQEHFINIITSDIGINFYKKKITLELITEDDKTLKYPFKIYINKEEIPYESFTTRKIKFLKFSDSIAISGFDCFDNVKYKSYLITFYTDDKTLLTDITITNDFNKFWGILNLSVSYFKCHNSCNSCTGYGIDQCTQCKPGTILNMATYNSQTKTSICVCDMDNGYYQISDDIYSLNCTHRKAPDLKFFYLTELSNLDFKPELWSSYYKQMSEVEMQICETKKILGQYDPQSQLYLEKTFNLTQNIENFEYSTLNFDFQFYMYKTITSYTIKVFFDDQYVWGQLYNLGNLLTPPSDEILICDTGSTKFYRKQIKFDYNDNQYFQNLINPNPKIRIEVYPDSECLFDSDCGWGISDFRVKVNRKTPADVNDCFYRPFSSEPCKSLNTSRACSPGYYESKTPYGEFSCLPCQINCHLCSSASKCNSCLPGYSIVDKFCVPSSKTLFESQTSMLRIDLNRYYKNLKYDFQGFSLNLWVKSGETLTTLDKPLLLIDPYLISYNSKTNNYNLKYTKFNYLFSYADLFSVVLNYTLQNNPTYYQSQWIPISITFSHNVRSQEKSFYIQMSINNEPLQSTYYDAMYLPSQIILFNYFSKVSYRYLKFWDKYLSIDVLNKINYIIPPSDLVFFYKFVEGTFKNRGTSDLIYILQKEQFRWTYDISSPNTCLENQYFDFKKNDCSSVCKHCYDEGISSCVECEEPNPFLDTTTKLCNPICPDSLVASYKYPTNKICQLACPSECLKCDNLNGCLQCKDGYFLYENTCIKYCTPEIAANNPACIYQSSSCTPSVKILDRPSYFFMDGTNLKLNLNVTDCGLVTSVKWKSSLDENSLIIHNKGKSLFVDASEFRVPIKHQFDVYLYDYNQTNILSQDSLEIDFVSSSINGGKVSAFYLNSTITFSIDVFHKIITPRLNGTVNYVWSCPYWVPFEKCNARSNRPTIVVDGNNILKDYFKGDLLYEVSVEVLVDKKLEYKLNGFTVVYSQRNIDSYFNFTITNYTQLGYNMPLKHKINFIEDIDINAIKNDLSIKWNINRTDLQYMNGDNLPVFYVNPKKNSYGAYKITCSLTYRKGTKVEKTIVKTKEIFIKPPPVGGVFKVVPSSGSFTEKFKLNVEGFSEITDPNVEVFEYKYWYYYLNPFGEYLPIEIRSVTSDYIPRIIPPTTSLKAKVQYDADSFLDLYKNVSISSDINFDYFTNVDTIFTYDIEDALLQLEAYSLNLKYTEYPNKKDLVKILENFKKKLDEIIGKSLEKFDLLEVLNKNIPKVGNILEAFTSKLESVDQVFSYETLYKQIFEIASNFNNSHIFSDPTSNNFIRAYDNLIARFDKGSNLYSDQLGITDETNKIISFALYDLDIGIEKFFNFNNIEIRATRINSFYLKQNITFDKLNRDEENGELIGENSRIDIYNATTTNSQNLRNLELKSANLSVTVCSSILSQQILDGTIQLTYFPKMRDQTNLDLKKVKRKVAFIPDMVQVKFLNKTKWAIITKINLTELNTNSPSSAPQSTTDSSAGELSDIVETVDGDIKTIKKYVTQYDFVKFNNESLLEINFKMPEIFTKDVANKTTCILIDENFKLGDDEEAICNTWFDYTNKIIKCECDQMGMYTVVFNPNFLYLRRRIQFPQLNDSINQPWGYGTLLILLGTFFILMFWAFKTDKKQLTQISNSSGKSQSFQEYRDKLNKDNLNLKRITFGKLYCDVLKYSNDYFSLKNYKDFYFLRAHRMLVFLLRMYIVVMFGFYNQIIKFDPIQQQLVEERNILIKSNKNNIYMWEGNWAKEIANSLYYALPMGIVMILCPRLSEWLFRYDEAQLRFEQGTKVVREIGSLYYGKMSAKCKKDDGNNFGRIKKNIEINPDAVKAAGIQNVEVTIEELKMTIDKRRFKAFINFNKMIRGFLFDVRYNMYKNEKRDNLPEDLAPLYNQKVQGQIEKFENRAFLTKKKFIKEIETIKEPEGDRFEIYKDKKRLLENIDIMKQGREFNQEDVVQENLQIEVKSRLLLEDDSAPIPVIKEKNVENKIKEEEDNTALFKMKEKEEEKLMLMKEKVEKEKSDRELKKTLSRNQPNAFIPSLINSNKKYKRLLLIKLVIIFMMIGALIYGITSNLIKLRNQGGNQRAIFWIILAAFSLLENYFFFIPILCIIKAILLMKYGAFHPKKFSCSPKYILFFLLVTDIDRAIFKELKQYVKNNNSKDKGEDVDENQIEISPITDPANNNMSNNPEEENKFTDLESLDENEDNQDEEEEATTKMKKVDEEEEEEEGYIQEETEQDISKNLQKLKSEESYIKATPNKEASLKRNSSIKNRLEDERKESHSEISQMKSEEYDDTLIKYKNKQENSKYGSRNYFSQSKESKIYYSESNRSNKNEFSSINDEKSNKYQSESYYSESQAQNQSQIIQDHSHIIQIKTKNTENQNIISQKSSQIIQNNNQIIQIKSLRENLNQSQNKPNLTQNMPNLTENRSNITQNMPNLTENRSNITQNMPNLTENRSNITQNMPNLTENKQNITQNIPNLTENKQNITQNKQNITEIISNPSQNKQIPTQSRQNITENNRQSAIQTSNYHSQSQRESENSYNSIDSDIDDKVTGKNESNEESNNYSIQIKKLKQLDFNDSYDELDNKVDDYSANLNNNIYKRSNIENKPQNNMKKTPFDNKNRFKKNP